MTDAERLAWIINELKETAYSFSSSIGLNKPDTIYNILNGKTPITVRTAKLITDTYQNLNFDWVLSGEGEKFKWMSKDIGFVEEEETEYKYATARIRELEDYIKKLELINRQQADLIEKFIKSKDKS